MKRDGQRFLDELASLPPDTFDHRFAEASTSLNLGRLLDLNELKLLYAAGLSALLCNYLINGMGKQGVIRPEDEFQRSQLEQDFMRARDVFYASPGWQCLTDAEQQLIENSFLSVSVTEDNLAG